MADDKKKKGASKFIKITACLLFVAIVVGLIIFFVPTNKSSLVDTLIDTKESMLLCDSDSRANYHSFTVRINANSRVSIYADEIDAIEGIADSLNEIARYYNDYIKFATSNRTYKNYNGKAKSAIEKANSESKKLNKLITDATKLTDSKETYLRNTWLEYRKGFLNYVKNYRDAFDALKRIYDGCFKESVSINPATKTNMEAVNAYIDILIDKINDLVETDKMHTETSSYEFNYGGLATNFDKFVTKHVKDTVRGENYYFDSSVYDNYQTIIAYLGENKFENLLQTVNESGTFELGEDASNDAKSVAKYLGGD